MAIIRAPTTLVVELFAGFEEQLILSVDRFELKSQLETTTAQDLLKDRKARLPASRLDVVDDRTRYPRRRGELRNAEVGSDAGAADECRSKLACRAFTHGVNVPNPVQNRSASLSANSSL